MDSTGMMAPDRHPLRVDLVTLCMRWLALRVADSGETYSTYSRCFGGVTEERNTWWFVTGTASLSDQHLITTFNAREACFSCTMLHIARRLQLNCLDCLTSQVVKMVKCLRCGLTRTDPFLVGALDFLDQPVLQFCSRLAKMA